MARVTAHLLFSALIHGLDVVVENGSDDGDHIRLNDPRPYVFRPSHSDIDDALKGEVPLPHLHLVLAPSLFQDRNQSLDAAIDGQDIANPGGRGCEICKVVEGVDEGEGGCAVESATVVERRRDADGRLVRIRDAEVRFSHDGVCAAVQKSSNRDEKLSWKRRITVRSGQRHGVVVAI